MENLQNNSESKKTIWGTIFAGGVILLVLFWWIQQAENPQKIVVTPTPSPTADPIVNEFSDINVGDLNSEFEEIDKEIQGL